MKSLNQRLRAAGRAAANHRMMAAECSDPQTRHEIEVSALAAEKEAAAISEAIEEVESLIFITRTLISSLRNSHYKASNINLALLHAEDAESRLIRELGQP